MKDAVKVAVWQSAIDDYLAADREYLRLLVASDFKDSPEVKAASDKVDASIETMKALMEPKESPR